MRSIDADALLSVLNSDDTLKHARRMISLYVEEAQTIEPPVVHGEWVWEKICDLDTRPICSRCYDEPYSDREMPNYCPNCGCRMEVST